MNKGDTTMMRRIAFVFALSLGFAAGAQACGENGAKNGKPEISKPANPKPAV